jgi:hypothetical protein
VGRELSFLRVPFGVPGDHRAVCLRCEPFAFDLAMMGSGQIGALAPALVALSLGFTLLLLIWIGIAAGVM